MSSEGNVWLPSLDSSTTQVVSTFLDCCCRFSSLGDSLSFRAGLAVLCHTANTRANTILGVIVGVNVCKQRRVGTRHPTLSSGEVAWCLMLEVRHGSRRNQMFVRPGERSSFM